MLTINLHENIPTFDDGGRSLRDSFLHTLGPIAHLEELLAQGENLDTRDPFTGETPLHNAAMCGAFETVQWLLSKGASWSFKDHDQQYAYNFSHHDIARLIFEHAVLTDYERYLLPYRDDPTEGFHIIDRPRNNSAFLSEPCFYMKLDVDGSGKGMIVDHILNRNLVPNRQPASNGVQNPVTQCMANPETYKLSGRLIENVMVSNRGSGVMMDWELPIMEASAHELMESLPKGASVLNIGFGLGLIDVALQEYKPAVHDIVEPHPNAVRRMQRDGWHKNPGVRIVQTTWQDLFIASPADSKQTVNGDVVASNEVSSGPVSAKLPHLGTFDPIYFDTYEEGIRDHLKFYKLVPSLMKGPHARFSFFHGVGQHGDQFVAQVYTDVVAMHLNDLGLSTSWTEVEIDKRRYWNGFSESRPAPDVPRLVPLCMLAPTIPRTVIARAPVLFDVDEIISAEATAEAKAKAKALDAGAIVRLLAENKHVHKGVDEQQFDFGLAL